MKKILLSLLGALLITTSFASAQVQTNYWKLQGGVLSPASASWTVNTGGGGATSTFGYITATTTNATSTFAGNVSIAGDLQVDGNFYAPVSIVSTGDITMNNNGNLNVEDGGSITFKADAMASTFSSIISTAIDTITFKNSGGFGAVFNMGSLTADRIFTMPDVAGTVALTSDIPTLGGSAGEFLLSSGGINASPYTGLTLTEVGGTQDRFTGTRIPLFYNNSSQLGVSNFVSNFHAFLDASNISGTSKTFLFPDASGTLALTSNITGGTLAGSFTTLAASATSTLATTTISSLRLGFTNGSVLFSNGSGQVAQQNSNFFWDSTNYRLGISTSTPEAALSVATGSIAVSEAVLATSTSMTIDWKRSNTQVVRVNTATTTITFSNNLPGATLKLLFCNSAGGGGPVTFSTAVYWSGGTAPTRTTTANKCDVYSFISTTATSSNVIFGSASTNF